MGWKNKALLLKWAWRFGTEKNALWRKVVCTKYGWDNRCLILHSVVDRYNDCSYVWQDILKTLYEDSILAKAFRNQIRCKVGSGSAVRFWLDPWVAQAPLHLTFPRIYALAVKKDAFVNEMRICLHRVWTWSIELRRHCLGWETDEESCFYSTINSYLPSKGEDGIFWQGDQRGLFSVKAICILAEQNTMKSDEFKVPKRIRKVVPPKISIFVWQASLNRIAVRENLVKRGLLVENQGRCSLCGLVMESTKHLLLHCTKIWKLWCDIMNREGLVWCCPEQLESLLIEWPELCVKSDGTLWELIPYALMWSVWLSRNDLIFNNKPFSMEATWDLHLSRISWWVKACWRDCSYTASDFLLNFENLRLNVRAVRNRKNEWFPPPVGVLKFNVDGSALGAPGRSGVGGVLRNSRRQIIGVFSKAVGELWANEAEVKAILQALIFCKQYHLRHIQIESDSTIAVGWTLNQVNRPWKLIQDLNLIDALCVEVDCISISHIYRESNPLADYLAKSGCWRELHIWSYFAGLDTANEILRQ